MNLAKHFFFFTRSKLITFILLSAALYYFMYRENAILGNLYTYNIQLTVFFTLYITLNILWFVFKSKTHFLIGAIVGILLVVTLQLLGNNSAQKRADAFEACLKTTNSQALNGEVMNCMKQKGYVYYR